MAQLNIAGSPTTTRHIKLYLLDFYRAIPQRHITFRIEASSSERATIRAASVLFSELKPGIAGLPTCTEPVEGACPTLQGEAPPWPDLVEVSFPPYEFTPSTPLLTFHSLLSTGDGDTKAASPLPAPSQSQKTSESPTSNVQPYTHPLASPLAPNRQNPAPTARYSPRNYAHTNSNISEW